jgi:hypothetical protein
MVLRTLVLAVLVSLEAAAVLVQTNAPSAMPNLTDTEAAPTTAQEDVPLPSVHTFPETKANAHLAPNLSPPPVSTSKVALIGGTVKAIDPIRNRMTVKVFGGGDMKVQFDGRSRVSSNGQEILPTKIRKGDRVYLDTQNIHGSLFARQVQVNNNTIPADVKGQITEFEPRSGRMRVFDRVSASEVKLTVTPQTEIRLRDAASDRRRLAPGAYISARFEPARGQANIAKQIQVIVAPGETFQFVGSVTNLDLRAGYLAIENRSDGTIYELRATPDELRQNGIAIGADVNVRAEFDGADYVVRSLEVLQAQTPEPESGSNPQ